MTWDLRKESPNKQTKENEVKLRWIESIISWEQLDGNYLQRGMKNLDRSNQWCWNLCWLPFKWKQIKTITWRKQENLSGHWSYGGCVSVTEWEEISVIISRINVHSYIEILDNFLVSSTENCFGDEKVIFLRMIMNLVTEQNRIKRDGSFSSEKACKINDMANKLMKSC